MNKQYKIFGITPYDSTLILRVLIEQHFGEEQVRVEQSLIRVIQIQATSKIIETNDGPEENTRINYLTANGIFYTNELSGLGIANNEDEATYIQLNFITTKDCKWASLIIPTKKNLAEEDPNNKYLNMIVEHLAPESYAIELKKEEIINFLLTVFSKMIDKNIFASQLGSN